MLTLIELALIGPLVSALHVHAVAEVRRGRDPQFAPVALQGLRVLPVVAAATIIAWLGITLGFFALIVPGIILSLRWYVVAQAAAIEHEGWLPALRRSRELTAGHYRHIVVFAIYVTLITIVPTLLVGFAFGHHSTTVASFLVGGLLQIVTWSFGALATALLYFDLRVRLEAMATQDLTRDSAPTAGDSSQTSHSWDPSDHARSDELGGRHTQMRVGRDRLGAGVPNQSAAPHRYSTRSPLLSHQKAERG